MTAQGDLSRSGGQLAGKRLSVRPGAGKAATEHIGDPAEVRIMRGTADVTALWINDSDPATARDRPEARPDGVVELRPLLHAAAITACEDRTAWRDLLRVANAVTAALVTRGQLPAHLTVGRDDDPALAARTIAAAWKHVTATPVQRRP